MRCCILDRCDDQHPLFIAYSVDGGVDAVEVDVLYLSLVDLDRCVVVEQYGCLHVCMPVCSFVRSHTHGWLGGAKAVEPRASRLAVVRIMSLRSEEGIDSPSSSGNIPLYLGRAQRPP
jgi:hypothetical protein